MIFLPFLAVIFVNRTYIHLYLKMSELTKFLNER